MIGAIVYAVTDHCGFNTGMRMRDALKVGRLAGVGETRRRLGHHRFGGFEVFFRLVWGAHAVERRRRVRERDSSQCRKET